jgi:dihydrofolate synthase / folylpolyglutamate synthase
MAEHLFPAAQTVVLTRPATPRAADPKRIAAELLPVLRGRSAFIAPGIDEALARAWQVTPRDGLICVAGSLYLVGEAKARLANRAPSGPTEKRP